jgi:hypothetical protein
MNNYLRVSLLCSFLFISISGYAVKPPADVTKESSSVVVHKKKKPGALKKWIIKRLTKKLQKQMDAKEKDPSLVSKAKTGLIMGIVSFSLLFIGLTAPWLFLFAAVAAILGDVFSIIVLTKTKGDKARYKKQRRKATWGLILSLLTGILPLALLLAVLISM